MATAQELEQALEPSRNDAQVTPKGATIFDLLKDPEVHEQMAMAVQSEAGAKRLSRILMTELRANPKLAGCTVQSLMGAALVSAQLDLEPGPLGLCYLIPRKNGQLSKAATMAAKKNVEVHEVHFELGYQGMLELAYRTGNVATIHADAIYEKDRFVYREGSAREFTHEPFWFGERGELLGYYGFVEFKGGGWKAEVRGMQEIYDRHRSMSMAYRNAEKKWDGKPARQDSPWHTHEDDMCKKTLVRILFKWMPKSSDLTQALNADQAVIDTELARYPDEGFNIKRPPVTDSDLAEIEQTVDTGGDDDEPDRSESIDVDSKPAANGESGDGLVTVDDLLDGARLHGHIGPRVSEKNARNALMGLVKKATGADWGVLDDAAAQEGEQILAWMEANKVNA